jgi:hypothetical protein
MREPMATGLYGRVIAVIGAMIGVLGALAACTSGPPLSPVEIAAQQRFQVGCLPSDAVGYEMAEPYCGKGN